MRTMFILLACSGLAVAAPPNRKQSSKGHESPVEMLPWEEFPTKDGRKEKYSDVVWSCSRNCNEITGDESWLMTLDMPKQPWTDSAPYGTSGKTGLPLKREEFRQEEERSHNGLYQWLLRRARRVNTKQLARAAVVIKWANGMELEMLGTQKDGFAKPAFAWKEPDALAATGIAKAPKAICPECEKKDRQIEMLTAELAKAKKNSRTSRFDAGSDRQRE